MSPLSLLLFSIFLLLLLEALWQKKDLFSPIRLWLMVWTAVIGLSNLKLSYYQSDWSLTTWFVLLSGVTFYVMGAICTNIMFTDVVPQRLAASAEIIDEKKLFKIILGLSLIFVCVFFIETETAPMGIPAFSDYPEQARQKVGLFAIHLFIDAYAVICVLAALYFLKVKSKKRRKRRLLLCLLTITILFLLLLNRLILFITIVTLMMLYNYMKARISIKHIVLATLLFSTVFLGIQQIRSSSKNFVENYVYAISRMRVSKEYSIVTAPYMYVAMNLENLNNGLESLDSHSLGIQTFDFLLALARIKHIFRESFPPKEDFAVFSIYNTFPYMWYLYWDFSYFGVILGSMLLGAIIAYAYNKMKVRMDSITVICYAFVSLVVFLSFFTTMYSRLSYVFSFTLLYVSVKSSTKR